MFGSLMPSSLLVQMGLKAFVALIQVVEVTQWFVAWPALPGRDCFDASSLLSIVVQFSSYCTLFSPSGNCHNHNQPAAGLQAADILLVPLVPCTGVISVHEDQAVPIELLNSALL